MVTRVLNNMVGDPGRMDDSLVFLNKCVTVREWHNLIASHMMSTSRFGWKPSFGVVVKELLSTTSVAFLLLAHNKNRLQALLSVTSNYAEYLSIWKDIENLLLKQCPTEHDKTIVGESHHVCPITLHECVNPVVASDGRVYERWAIFRHMMTRGLISPITNMPLEANLFPMWV